MTKIKTAVLISAIATATILMAGCQKVLDYIHLTTTDGKADLKICAIKNLKVTNTFVGSGVVQVIRYSFHYNWLGNPDSVVTDNVATGNPNLIFKYDKHNRLIEFQRPYTLINGNGNYETWDKYGYNNKNQIVQDTQYVFGSVMDSVPEVLDLQVTYTRYAYDAQDRIVAQTDSIYRSGKFSVANSKSYIYDSKGNLVTGAVYDDKLNIKRTNTIWMFITKDYSVNNPLKSSAYNSFGLPLYLSNAYEALNIIAPQPGVAEVQYLCR